MTDFSPDPDNSDNLDGSAPSYHMSPDEFRHHGHALIDWLAHYMETVGERQVMPDVEPGDIAASIPATAPEEPERFEDLIRDLDEVVMPGVTHWQSPGWFAYYPATTSGPSILGELVSAGLGMQGMLWSTSPAATEIENRVTDWLVDLLGLPAAWQNKTGPGGGVLQSSASDSTHLVHVVARERAMAGQTKRPAFVAYTSGQAHSSVEKGARVAGIEHFRAIDVDENLSLDPEALRAAITADRDAGIDATHRHERHRYDGDCGGRSRRRDIENCERRRPVAPRRRGIWWFRHDLSGAPAPPGGRRDSRQLHVQSPQVDVHELRLQRSLGCRSRFADRRHVYYASVFEECSFGVRPGDRLPRLAGAPGPAVPGTQAVVGAAQLWR